MKFTIFVITWYFLGYRYYKLCLISAQKFHMKIHQFYTFCPQIITPWDVGRGWVGWDIKRCFIQPIVQMNALRTWLSTFYRCIIISALKKFFGLDKLYKSIEFISTSCLKNKTPDLFNNKSFLQQKCCKHFPRSNFYDYSSITTL